ncbi:chemotaxis protein CheC [Virgibacillus sp. 179-BFC.A HS]|uniref:Chemotaxis protein CheC n=1 Tax=Tigheibacillus jepli TaxID=3035914 RepID=A0ABU5CJ46_9BACI|nr:chemotaxis protein CheC [Virgibacillus sp. 179-BFC.A HS]MDY0405867.1 chemotaxis protein CheC [Virgibacillus sp. 179-BFC.A HS]
MDYLTNLQRDVLKEIGNVGSGNAATSMSKLMNQEVALNAPGLKIIPFEEVVEMLGGAETPVAANMFRIESGAPGIVFFILSIQEADIVVKRFTNQSIFNENNEPNELAVSALQEFANILTGSYLSALSDFTGLKMKPSIPFTSIDMAGAVISEGILEISQRLDYAIVIDTVLVGKEAANQKISGQFLFLPYPDSFSKIFHSLGIDRYE